MPTTPDDPQTPSAEGGPLSLPDEWVGMPPARPESARRMPDAVPAAGTWPAASAPLASATQNSRALIGVILGGLAAAGAAAAWVGLGFVPLLGVIGLGIGGIVLSAMALTSVRRGLATNRGLAVTGLVLSILGIVGVVALYAYVIALVGALVGGTA
ncbi:hypothetical protein [Demequina lignilytica]|uniref:DUF4190 domain-containing protein n=1 Tax=Demequina lignilytica TaxID=3051663 RepID=A0AB35MKL6_9MICO|nr:hypothetical protein [Demequina sp. SYSU T0a273]MDN4484303.1 hypothetical protein [Demequina sp. SYSU T0a273]